MKMNPGWSALASCAANGQSQGGSVDAGRDTPENGDSNPLQLWKGLAIPGPMKAARIPPIGPATALPIAVLLSKALASLMPSILMPPPGDVQSSYSPYV